MITIGLVKELAFISRVLKTPVRIELKTNLAETISVSVEKNLLQVSYQGYNIWREIIESDTSFFGVESCDSISRIIYCLNNKDIYTAKRMFFDGLVRNPLDKQAS